ncbi:NPCBM/NEW2 domain-containing protein [Deinococcus sp.]|uniref:NPCBM/NEW2 domain-containing protein n=1 Tax=Deinococcus sp. TaxID=47478 RepID=UPI003C7CB228
MKDTLNTAAPEQNTLSAHNTPLSRRLRSVGPVIGLTLLTLSLAACGSGTNTAPQTSVPVTGTGTTPTAGTGVNPDIALVPYKYDGQDRAWTARSANTFSTQAIVDGSNDLSAQNYASATSGWGPVEINRSNGESVGGDGNTLTLNGKTYTTGLGVHAASEINYDLNGQCTGFQTDMGVDDEVRSLGSVTFEIWADGTKLYDSGLMTGNTATKSANVDLTGRKQLKLIVTNGGDNLSYDHADWAGATLLGCKSSGITSNWTSIASEWQTFTLTTASTVRYGVGTAWIQKDLAAGTYTCSNALFGDPAYGYAKHCEVSGTTAWSNLATESQNFTLSATSTVRYGSGSSWIQKTLAAGTYSCSNATFGNDPAPGVSKVCQVSGTAVNAVNAIASPSATTYSGPLVITKGGTYSGNWESQDPNTPAVDIRTSEPVVIQNSNIRGKGNIIAAVRARLTVRNTNAVGLNPNVYGRAQGNFLNLNEMYNLDVENNTVSGTLGIYIRAYVGNNAANDAIKILRNKFKNIDGRPSDGNNGYQSAYSDQHPHTVQFNGVQKIANAEIAWNEVINEPGKSLVEENINLYVSSGVPGNPILIHDNYIQGAYNPQPASDTGFAGGGILIGDGLVTDPSLMGYTEAYNNQIVSTTNEGMTIVGGVDSKIYNNRIISSGLLPDGRPIAAQNVGLYIWDINGAGKFSPPTFFNNSVYGNYVVWTKVSPNGSTNENPFWLVECGTFNTYCTNNVSGGKATSATEAQEYQIWLNKLSANNVTIGN